MWPHFVNLLSRTWQEVLRAFSTSTLSITVWTVAIPTVTWLANVGVQFWLLRRRKVISSLKGAFSQSWVSAAVSVVITVVAWIVIFGCFVTKTAYDDHEDLAGENKQLRNSNSSLRNQLTDATKNAEKRCEETNGKEIKRLTTRLNLACYLPDRRLSAEQRDTLFQEFKRLAKNQKNPTITLGCFNRERESCKFMDDIREIINHAGWTTLLSGTNGDWIAKRGSLTGITVVEDKQAKDSKNYAGYGMILSSAFYNMGFEARDLAMTEATDIHGLTLWIGYKVYP